MRGFEFKTKINRYYYDYTDGTVTCITKENMNEMIKALSVDRKKLIVRRMIVLIMSNPI